MNESSIISILNGNFHVLTVININGGKFCLEDGFVLLDMYMTIAFGDMLNRERMDQKANNRDNVSQIYL